jgi:hypothetical protein
MSNRIRNLGGMTVVFAGTVGDGPNALARVEIRIDPTAAATGRGASAEGIDPTPVRRVYLGRPAERGTYWLAFVHPEAEAERVAPEVDRVAASMSSGPGER